MSPQQIRAAKKKETETKIAFDLRKRFKIEDRYKAISDEKKESLRKAVLLSWGYDPSVPMRKLDMRLRQLYHRHPDELIKDHKFLELFDLLESHLDDLPEYLKIISDLGMLEMLPEDAQERFLELEYFLKLSDPTRDML